MTIEEYRHQRQNYDDTARDRDEQLTGTIQAMQYAGPEAVSGEQIEEERIALEGMKSQHEQWQHHHEHHDDYQVIEGGRGSIVEDNYVKISPYTSSSKKHNTNHGPPHSSHRCPSLPHDAHPLPPPPTDPHHQFTIGSMVRVNVQKGEPLYGVLQWVGTVPDFNGTIAGVELVSDYHCEVLCYLI